MVYKDIKDLYLFEVDATKRRLILCKNLIESDTGKLTPQYKLTAVCSAKCIQYAYEYIGQQCNITLDVGANMIFAIWQNPSDSSTV